MQERLNKIVQEENEKEREVKNSKIHYLNITICVLFYFKMTFDKVWIEAL